MHVGGKNGQLIGKARQEGKESKTSSSWTSRQLVGQEEGRRSSVAAPSTFSDAREQRNLAMHKRWIIRNAVVLYNGLIQNGQMSNST